MTDILTAILVLITGGYAWITFKILKANEGVLHEMRLQQEAFYRPCISISPVLYSDSSLFYLKIKNTGSTAAQKLKLRLDRDFYQFGSKDEKKNLKNLPVFSTVIDSFVPNSEMLFYLATAPSIFREEADKKNTPSMFTITAEYQYLNKEICENTIIDLRPYLNSVQPHDPIVEKLKEIRESVDSLAQS